LNNDNDLVNVMLAVLFNKENNSTAHGNQINLSRSNENTFSHLSPDTEHLHTDLVENSPARMRTLTKDAIRASQQNMIANIEYIVENGNIEKNKKGTEIF
jgi:hypothetical protein